MRVCSYAPDGIEKLFSTGEGIFGVYLLDEIVLQ